MRSRIKSGDEDDDDDDHHHDDCNDNDDDNDDSLGWIFQLVFDCWVKTLLGSDN